MADKAILNYKNVPSQITDRAKTFADANYAKGAHFSIGGPYITN